MVQPDFYMMHAAGWQGYVDSINYMNPENYVFSSSYPLADMKTMVEYYLNCGIKEERLPNSYFSTYCLARYSNNVKKKSFFTLLQAFQSK